MTTVYENSALASGTHALVIGVGVYDHLLGGDQATLDDPFGLGQLSAPPVSAAAVAHWLLQDLVNAQAPLASLEVLISAPEPVEIQTSTGSVVVEPATMASIKAAASQWFARANASEENVAFFYHCGHGLQSSDLALLAQDFGSPGGDPPSPWDNAYNFHRLYRGMARCAAKGQFFFVDACRQVSSGTLAFDGLDLATLVAPTLRGTNTTRSAPIIFATARESRAWAAQGETSRFCAALLKALSSNGAMRGPDGVWQVSNESLGKAVSKRIELGNAPGVPEQQCALDGEQVGSVMLHTLAGPPPIPLQVTKAGASATTCLEFLPGAGQPAVASFAGPSPWLQEVVAGTYCVVARDGDATVADLGEDWVLPPTYERVLP